MRIRRYFAADMRQALRQVREAQGPDAVILSTRKADGGVEVVAAADYDQESLYDLVAAPVAGAAGHQDAPASPGRQPAGSRRQADHGVPRARAADEPTLAALRAEVESIRSLLERQLSGLAWGELGRRQPQRAALLRRVAELELHPRLVRELVGEVPAGATLEAGWRHVLALLAQRVRECDDELLSRGGIVALVGSTGVGKTTTVAKLAARFAMRHGPNDVALVTTDDFRVGAVEQLRTFARLMGVPVRAASGREELQAVLGDLSGRRLVLIDTAGMSQRDVRLSEQLAVIRDGSPLARAYAVLPATAQRPALEEVVCALSGTPLDGCIVTKLDEATGLGAVLSVVVQHQLPVAYVSDGQRVPEDLRPARTQQLLSQAVAAMERSGQAPDDESMESRYGALTASGQL
jgi:flagellar biosynthesis protein FlhF